MAVINYNNFNNAVKEWGDNATNNLKRSAQGLGITHRANSPSKGASVPKIKNDIKFQDGQASRISYKFPRALIMTHKGAGKGVGGIKGSRWIDKNGKNKSTNPKSLGKIGTDKSTRKAKPFFNETLGSDQGVELLATIVAEQTGDIITGNFLI